MTSRIATVLLAVGLLLEGCTIQKRSVMPGWHVEWAGRVSSVTSPTSSGIPVDSDKEANEHASAVVSIPHVPPLPLKALMAYSPPVSKASAHPKLRFTERKKVLESCQGHEVGSDDKRGSNSDPSDGDNSVFGRIFMGLLALTLDVASVPLISLGLGFGSWAFVMLGVGVLWLSWFAWLSAFPKFRSRVREKNNWKVKQKRREEKRQARNNEPLWLANLPLTILVAAAFLFLLSLSR